MNTRFVHCPQCGEPVAWDAAHRFRPFCSERCRLIDLGAWATDSYRIPVRDNDIADDTEPEEDSGARQ